MEQPQARLAPKEFKVSASGTSSAKPVEKKPFVIDCNLL
jgi:hypothetical protein